MTLARIDAVASRRRCRYPWTRAAAEALGYTYYQYGHPLANSAAYYLHEWVSYSIQHGGLGQYATSKKAQADHSANEFWRAIKTGVLNPPPHSYEMTAEASLILIEQQEAEVEAQLSQRFPSRPIRSNNQPNIINTFHTQALRPEAAVFVPKAQRSRTTNSASHPRISREDSGYSSLAESNSKQSEQEQTRVEKKGAASTINFVHDFSEIQKEPHPQQDEIIHAEAISSSSTIVTRSQRAKASVQVRCIKWHSDLTLPC